MHHKKIIGALLLSVAASIWGGMFVVKSVVAVIPPAFMVLFSWLLLHTRPSRGDWISLVFASVGVILIVGLQFTGHKVLLGHYV